MKRDRLRNKVDVTPFVGVWIETFAVPILSRVSFVTPFVGVWIETHVPLEEGGEKTVTPFVGVWIETQDTHLSVSLDHSHTLRGCVD